MHILDIEIGKTVKLNRSPTYGEAEIYLSKGMEGNVVDVDFALAIVAVKFKECCMYICPMDIDPVLH